jgi:hypothetical protein
MSLDKAMKNLKLDVRLVEKNLSTGQLTQKELESHLQSLPDCAANVDLVNLSSHQQDKESVEQHH